MPALEKRLPLVASAQTTLCNPSQIGLLELQRRSQGRWRRKALWRSLIRLEYDGDFVTELIPRGQRKFVTAPELAGIEPVVVLLGGEQAHLLVGDGDGFCAVSGFESNLDIFVLL